MPLRHDQMPGCGRVERPGPRSPPARTPAAPPRRRPRWRPGPPATASTAARIGQPTGQLDPRATPWAASPPFSLAPQQPSIARLGQQIRGGSPSRTVRATRAGRRRRRPRLTTAVIGSPRCGRDQLGHAAGEQPPLAPIRTRPRRSMPTSRRAGGQVGHRLREVPVGVAVREHRADPRDHVAEVDRVPGAEHRVGGSRRRRGGQPGRPGRAPGPARRRPAAGTTKLRKREPAHRPVKGSSGQREGMRRRSGASGAAVRACAASRSTGPPRSAR